MPKTEKKQKSKGKASVVEDPYGTINLKMEIDNKSEVNTGEGYSLEPN